MRSIIMVCLLGLSCVSADAEDMQNPETLTERSQASAREIVERAATALGGTATLRAIEIVRYRYEGDTWERLQMQSVSPPFKGGSHRQTVLLDLKNNRARIDLDNHQAGAHITASIVIEAGTGRYYNHRTRSVAPMSAAQVASQAPYYRRLPQLLLRDALANEGSLRHLGRDSSGGKAREVITYVTPRSEQVSLYIDVDTNLVSKGELLYLDPLTGDEASEFAFSDYTRVGKHLVPQTWIDSDAGAVAARFRARVEIDPTVAADAFKVERDGYVDVAPVPPPQANEVEKLADGVFVMRNLAGPNQHSMAIEFKDYIAVIEAPGSSAGADKLIARIKETIPRKPIRYLAITHHHGDHVGGVRSFIAEGATVITTPGNRAHVEALARAPLFDRLKDQPRKVDIVTISQGKHVLSDGQRTVELIDIGPNPHATEMLIAYLPRERVLFEADAFTMPVSKRPLYPAFEQTVSFAKRVRELGLKVDRIAGAHGPTTATAAEFTEITQLEL